MGGWVGGRGQFFLAREGGKLILAPPYAREPIVLLFCGGGSLDWVAGRAVSGGWRRGVGNHGNLGLLGMLVFVVISMLVRCIGASGATGASGSSGASYASGASGARLQDDKLRPPLPPLWRNSTKIDKAVPAILPPPPWAAKLASMFCPPPPEKGMRLTKMTKFAAHAWSNVGPFPGTHTTATTTTTTTTTTPPHYAK